MVPHTVVADDFCSQRCTFVRIESPIYRCKGGNWFLYQNPKGFTITPNRSNSTHAAWIHIRESLWSVQILRLSYVQKRHHILFVSSRNQHNDYQYGRLYGRAHTNTTRSIREQCAWEMKRRLETLTYRYRCTVALTHKQHSSWSVSHTSYVRNTFTNVKTNPARHRLILSHSKHILLQVAVCLLFYHSQAHQRMLDPHHNKQ